MPDLTVAKRVQRFRRRRADEGLVRVELVVPRDKVAQIKAYAAELRAPAIASRRLERLIETAIDRFAPTCFWNIDLSRRDAAIRDVMVARLRKHGGHDGWALASEIDRMAGGLPR